MLYSLKKAAALLGMGRNTLARTLRDEGILGEDNLPAGRYLGGPYLTVKTTTYHHPVLGYTHGGKTLITERGLDWIAKRLGVQFDHDHPQEEIEHE